MALDRESIERKDFPTADRGYDPDAVDAHLRAVAVEVEELRRAPARRGESVAAAATEQVRAILEAAENTAAEIRRQAEAEAGAIRTEAQARREQASVHAREDLVGLSETAATLLGRLSAIQNELGALFDELRTGAQRLNAGLGSRADDARGSAGGASEARIAPAAPDDHAVPESSSEKVQGDALLGARAPAQGGSDDTEAARLVALNMALDQKSRAETERYLAENFRVADVRGLVADVYAALDG